MKGIMVIGPREWGNDHREWLRHNPFAAMQYSAQNLRDAGDRLQWLALPFPLFVYVPYKYRNTPNGSGTVEFVCRTLAYEAAYPRQPSPWPTIDGPKWYDQYSDLIEKCSIPVTDFVFHRKDGFEHTYDSVRAFIGPAHGKILFCTLKDRSVQTRGRTYPPAWWER
jgi:hypothetical protein